MIFLRIFIVRLVSEKVKFLKMWPQKEKLAWHVCMHVNKDTTKWCGDSWPASKGQNTLGNWSHAIINLVYVIEMNNEAMEIVVIYWLGWAKVNQRSQLDSIPQNENRMQHVALCVSALR